MFTEQGALPLPLRQEIEAQAAAQEKDWREDLSTIRQACQCYAINPFRIGDYQELYFTRCTAIKQENRPGWIWDDVRREAVADVLEAILEEVFPMEAKAA